MITLKRLAELSGCSIRTVKRVLDGAPHVNPEKRRTIMELAAAANYVPNMAARSLRMQKKNCVGIISDCGSSSAAVRKLTALNTALLAHGFSPMLGEIRPGHEEECRCMFARWAGVAEYVVVFPFAEKVHSNFFREAAERFPLKFIFVDCMQEGFAAVPLDRAGSVADAVCRIADMGRAHLCYCGSLPNRLEGVKQASAAVGKRMRITTIECGYEAADAEKSGREIMATGADTLLLDTDRAAAGFYRYAHRNGIRIPDDIAVVGFDNEDFAELLTPPLASIAHPVAEITARICGIIMGGKVESKPLLMPLIVRESLKKV